MRQQRKIGKYAKILALIVLVFGIFVAFWDITPEVREESKVLPNALFKE